MNIQDRDFEQYLLTLFREGKGRDPSERELALLKTDAFKQMFLDLTQSQKAMFGPH